MAKPKANLTLNASKGAQSSTTNARSHKKPVKKAPVKQTLAKHAKSTKAVTETISTKQTPAKQTPAKQTPAKQTPSQTPLAPPGKQIQNDTVARIWTPNLAQSFYANVNALCSKLNDYQSPKLPKNYRIGSKNRRNAGDYTLLYEEELHLTDHFAFLAHVEEGVKYVSATTIEESHEPHSFTVRLASNHTPIPDVKEGLEKILQIVREHAHKGRHAEEYKTRLFDEVVKFSQKRIYARLRCSRWEKPGCLKDSNPPPLHIQIKAHLLKLGAGPLRLALAQLIESLERVDEGATKDPIELVKDVILKSHAVSHQGDAKSLEATLRRLKLAQTICESRAVLEIDKLSKYLDLCNDLIRLSRQRATRVHCQDLKLEICPAYPSSQPLGATAKCFVHAEVQLILFYEQYPKRLPPRAIGASKSACFLCDLFIKNHGAFGISHSHMKLYAQWTIPDTTWMNARQIQSFQSIVQAMNSDIEMLLNTKLYSCNAVIESRAHILQIGQTSRIASSVASPVSSKPHLVTGPEIRIPTISSVALEANSSLTRIKSTLYYFQDLPIAVSILPSTISCILLVGKVDYIFDLAGVETGQLLISEVGDSQAPSENPRIDVRELSSSLERRIESLFAPKTIAFNVHDADKYELRVTMTLDTRLNR